MRRLLLPSLLLALPFLQTAPCLFAQSSNAPEPPTAPQLEDPAPAKPPLEPILAEAPANAPEHPPAPAPAGSPAKISYSSCNVEGQVLAMTFDDGPHAQNTPRLLDILKERGIKATFFVVGQNAVEYPDILKRIAAEGHELANHSYTHPILASMGEGAIRDQLDKTHQAVLSATGVSMKLLRPPYGALSQPQRAWANAAFGYKTILWDVDPLDWKFRDAARVQSEILSHAKSGSIILSHDIHKSTVDAMPATLDALAAKGFKFVTVTELLAMDRPAAPKPSPTPAPKPTANNAKETTPKKTADKSPANENKNSKTASTVSKNSVASTPSSPASGASTSTAASPKSAPSSKPAQLSQEELRKKWLQSMNQP